MKKILILSSLALASWMHHTPKNEASPPPASKETPLPSKKNIFYVDADFLWWKAQVDGTELATVNTKQSDGSFKKTVVELNGKWEPGFRAGVGYRFGHFDEWDLGLLWTHYRGESHDVSKEAGDISSHFLRQNWITFLGPVVTSAHGNWDVELNVADLTLGRSYSITKKIFLRPYVGVRAVWIDLDYRAHYDGVWTISSTVTSLITATLMQKTRFKGDSDFGGGGLRLGTDFLGQFASHWGILADLSASLLYGQFKVKERFVGADVTSSPTSLAPETQTYKDILRGVRVNLDASLGLKWWKSWNRYQFSLFAGYELSEWFRANELFHMIRSIDTFPVDATHIASNVDFFNEHQSGDIGFQGLTLRASLEF